MKITIPENISKLIEQHRTHGDFVEISKRLTKTDENVDGDDTRSQEVHRAVKKGAGEVDVVSAITDYYKEKESIVAKMKMAS